MASNNSPLQRRGGGYVYVASRGSEIHHPTVAEIFDPARDLEGKKAYQKQGDETMYTPEMISKRNGLKTDPIVEGPIEEFLDLYNFDDDGCINRDEYFRVHLRIARALVPTASERRLRGWVQEDWERDSGGHARITRSQMYDSVFELVDQWTTTAEADEYKAFIEALGFRVKYTGQQDPQAYSILGSK